VIRGFDGDRVLVLQDGVRTGSLGSQSGDHSEPIDPLSLERLEVVKGPATLLYGSNAVGGVVNAITNDDDDSHEGFRGYFSGLGSTANRQGAISGGVEYGYKNWLFSGRGSSQREGDFQSPIGRIPNSGSKSFFGTGNVGYYGQKGFATFNLSSEKRRYGVPFAALFEEEKERPLFGETLPEPPDEEIDLRIRQNNYRFRGGFRDIQSFVNRITFSFNYTDYKHEEIENETVGTVFNNDTASYRTVFEQKATEKLTGRFGFEGYTRDYLILGDEALIEGKVKAGNFAVFALEELKYGRISFQFGGRIENNRFRPENPDLRDRSFNGFSGAVGMRIGLWKEGAFVVNYTNSYRAPAIEELYNNGPHIGTMTFEIGNENLLRERSNGLDFSIRHLSDRIRLDFDFYYYRINDFVFLAPVEEGTKTRQLIGGGLPVAEYLQQNSNFIGGEFNLDAKLNKYVSFLAAVDVVRAELDDDTPLPRIPPDRIRLGLDFHYKNFNLRPEAIFVADKERGDIFPTETSTAGYGLFNLGGSYTIGSQHYAHTFSFGAYNLTNKLYRNHLSFIKELVPEIGRGVRFSYTFRFF
jgi:iron complex outermembrane receptor protein